MAKFASIDNVIDIDTGKTERTFVNIDLVISVKREDKHWAIKSVNGDRFHVLELPTFVSESIFPPQ